MSDQPLITFNHFGQPRPKGRPRFRIVKPRGKPQFVTTYTDPETAAYESSVAKAGRVAMGSRNPLEGALTVLVEAFFDIPQSWTIKKRSAAADGSLPHTGRVDGDNIAKAILDACNEVVYRDDGQIVSLTVIKQYAEIPFVRFTAWEWDDIGPDEPDMLSNQYLVV